MAGVGGSFRWIGSGCEKVARWLLRVGLEKGWQGSSVSQLVVVCLVSRHLKAPSKRFLVVGYGLRGEAMEMCRELLVDVDDPNGLQRHGNSTASWRKLACGSVRSWKTQISMSTQISKRLI